MTASKTGWILDVAEADFEREVIERSRQQPVVVDFWAPWCGPCRMLGPLLEKLVEERGGDVILAKVNIDEAQYLAAQFGIEAIPAVKAFREGRPVLEFVGLLPEAQLRQFLDQISPSEADRVICQAGTLETTNPTEAATLYRRALEKEPKHAAALVGLARLLMNQGQEAEARTLLDQVDTGGDQGPEVERLEMLLSFRQQAAAFGTEADARRRLAKEPENAQARFELGSILAASGRYEEALELLLSAAERDRKLATSAIRELMVKIFQIIGVRSPVADEYRDKLSRLLY